MFAPHWELTWRVHTFDQIACHIVHIIRAENLERTGPVRTLAAYQTGSVLIAKDLTMGGIQVELTYCTSAPHSTSRTKVTASIGCGQHQASTVWLDSTIYLCEQSIDKTCGLRSGLSWTALRHEPPNHKSGTYLHHHVTPCNQLPGSDTQPLFFITKHTFREICLRREASRRGLVEELVNLGGFIGGCQ
jgi:hypothetical protein